ncbi:MAG: CPBP family intramembrane glutamic endopeptidase [Clostridium butyricum]|nr:CPBP family intramembrane glutamic endopeptidase [Clostridium butyricum]
MKNICIKNKLKPWRKILITRIAYVIGVTVIAIISSILMMLSGADFNTIDFIINGNDVIGNSTDIILNIIDCLGLILSVVFFWKVIDKKPISDIGITNIKTRYKDLLKGLALGAVSMTIVLVILFITKNISFENSLFRPNLDVSLITGLITFIFVGVNEELFCRGYCITVLNQSYNRYISIIWSAVIFSLLHSFNDNMSVISYLNLFLFGILAAYMFNKSNNIWMCIGYHITWNYFQGSIFGFQVSGNNVSSMYNVNLSNNNIITGGGFGPEGGIIVTFVILLGILYVWKFYKPQNLE